MSLAFSCEIRNKKLSSTAIQVPPLNRIVDLLRTVDESIDILLKSNKASSPKQSPSLHIEITLWMAGRLGIQTDTEIFPFKIMYI